MHKLKLFILIYFCFAILVVCLLYYKSGANERAQQLLLRDDGYTRIAKNFVRGNDSLMHKEVGPGLPLIYAPAFLLPETLQPIVRYLLTVFINIMSILIFYQIARKLRISDAAFLVAGFFLVLHPVFVHWTIKSAPDPLITLFLLLFVYFVLNGRKYWPIAAAVFFASIFVRPTVLLVPLMLLFVALLQKEKSLFFFAMTLLVLSTAGYWLNNKMTVEPHMEKLTTYSSGLHEVVMDAYFVDNVLRTTRFNTGALNWPDGNRPMAHQQYWTWMRRHREANDNRFTLLLKFVAQHPRLMMQKILLNPVFFLCMCATTFETWITLIYNIVLLLLAIVFIVRNRLAGSEKIIIWSALGYFLIFWIGHSYSRYIYALLPFLALFAARGLMGLMKMSEKNSHKCAI